MKQEKLFVYGSLLLNQHKFNFSLEPIESVFIRGYKVIIEKSPTTKINYHYLKLIQTNNENDIIPGFIVELNEENLNLLDTYEGDTYVRIKINYFNRSIISNTCYVYVNRK